MTGSPFSNVVGTDQDSSTFEAVLSTQVGDTTTESGVATTDSGTEPSVAVEATVDHDTHVSGEDETQDQTDASGQSQINT